MCEFGFSVVQRISGREGRGRTKVARMTTSGQSSDTIEALFKEQRRFEPPADFAAHANARPGIYDDAERDYLAFWRSWADKLAWSAPYGETLEWNEPFAKWFVGGKLNASVNALDRHVAAGKGSRIAYYFEGEPGDRREITYAALLAEVCRVANGLREIGVRRGDRVAIYMPMIPELPVAMLACARIGAAHSVIFGGFSADAIVDRVNDAACSTIITADQGWRRGKKVPLKDTVDVALAQTPCVERVVVVKRVGDAVEMKSGRDFFWDDVVAGQPETCEPEAMDSEDLLFLLYTSGTTAKPKGIMHTTAGYLTGVTATHELVFDLKDDDIYWCTADIGWVTGHSYIVYGPLCNGATSVLYEGTPDFPDKDRLWAIVERYAVTIFYTAPTAIRTFMKWGVDFLERHDLSSLRLLGSVGEPINPEAWMWYHDHVGGGRCPIVDTWWQTETGAATRHHDDETGQRDETVSGHARGHRRRGGQERTARRRRLHRDPPSLARDAARHLRGARAVQGDVLVEIRAHVSRGRRMQSRRRRRLLVHGPHRRRDERERPSHFYDRSRERARRPSRGCRGRRRRQERRYDGSNDLLFRFAAWFESGLARTRGRATQTRR